MTTRSKRIYTYCDQQIPPGKSLIPRFHEPQMPKMPDSAAKTPAIAPARTPPTPVSAVINAANAATPAPAAYAFWSADAAQLFSKTPGGSFWNPFRP